MKIKRSNVSGLLWQLFTNYRILSLSLSFNNELEIQSQWDIFVNSSGKFYCSF